MNEVNETEVPAAATVDRQAMQLGQWMGRREAFSLVAGRCSAADISILRRIREEKLYTSMNCTWEEYCERYLHVARRTAEREIGYLLEFGPVFFTVRQLTHIGVNEYRAIAPHITEHGVSVDGTVVPLLPDHSEPVAAAIEELLQRRGSGESEPDATPFDALLKRCQSTGRALRAFEESLDAQQSMALVTELAEIRNAGETLGARFIDVSLEVRQ